MTKVDNAVIMAAGTSSRFAPLSFEKPKSLFPVRGEILLERQIRQIKEAGIEQIIIVVGYMKERFSYLKSKYGVTLIENNDYLRRNNNGSIYAAKKYLRNSYICSADNYFIKNPFEKEAPEAYYSVVFIKGATQEWCVKTDRDGYIKKATIGGRDSWCMLGHAFWDEQFSARFVDILEKNYNEPRTAPMLWESIFLQHTDMLSMKIRKYPRNCIYEFDQLDELRRFDHSYVDDSRSFIIKDIVNRIGCSERDIVNIRACNGQDAAATGFFFQACDIRYQYFYQDKEIRRMTQ